MGRCHYIANHQRSQQTVSGCLVIGKNNVSGILSAQGGIARKHCFQDMAVTHIGGDMGNTRLSQGPGQTDVAHDRTDDGVVSKPTVFLQVSGANRQDPVPGQNMAVFINRDYPVPVPVKSKSRGSSLVNHLPAKVAGVF
jgi:hypothetical protein